MSRFVAALGGVAAVLVVLVVGWWYLAFTPFDGPPGRVRVADLDRPVRVHLEEETPHVDAPTATGLYTGIGYSHGYARPWTALLLRQIALGRLSAWFDGPARELDHWSRQLGFARTAREVYRNADLERRELLEAYARGIRAALADRESRTDELLLLEVRPDRWEPWHGLAVRYLVAWLGTAPPEVADSVRLDSATAERLRVDTQLRDWLHLYGFGHSRAWVGRRRSGEEVFVQQHVYGRTARVPFQPVTASLGASEVELLSVPGTTIWPGGKTEERAWSVFLGSTAELERVPPETTMPPPLYERIDPRGHDEEIVAVRSRADRLYLSPEWRLRWSGFDAAGASFAWSRLWSSAPISPQFTPFDGNGLIVDPGGSAEILGQPSVRRAAAGLIYAGGGRWAEHGLRRLADRVASGEMNDAQGLVSDTYSPWSDSLRSDLIDLLIEAGPSDAQLREATTYLRNWDGTYPAASIGASIFDTWMDVYRRETDRLPDLEDAGEEAERSVRYRAFDAAVDSLVRRYGPDPSVWRWEAVQPDRRYFPAWSDSAYLPSGLEALASGRYAPLDPSGSGHPSALEWGATQASERPTPGVWSMGVDGSDWQVSIHRGRPAEVDRFLGRYLSIERFGTAHTVTLGERSGTEVRLVPDAP